MVRSKENQWGRKAKRHLNPHPVRGKEKPEFRVCISLLDWLRTQLPTTPSAEVLSAVGLLYALVMGLGCG